MYIRLWVQYQINLAQNTLKVNVQHFWQLLLCCQQLAIMYSINNLKLYHTNITKYFGIGENISGPKQNFTVVTKSIQYSSHSGRELFHGSRASSSINTPRVIVIGSIQYHPLSHRGEERHGFNSLKCIPGGACEKCMS